MITISLDEGAVFDILAINMIKNFRNPSKNLDNIIAQMEEEISNQIGFDKREEIINSKEFQELVNVNDKVFDLIDEAQSGDGLARAVQDGNRKRYDKKIALQKKFFHDVITEEKM